MRIARNRPNDWHAITLSTECLVDLYDTIGVAEEALRPQKSRAPHRVPDPKFAPLLCELRALARYHLESLYQIAYLGNEMGAYGYWREEAESRDRLWLLSELLGQEQLEEALRPVRLDWEMKEASFESRKGCGVPSLS